MQKHTFSLPEGCELKLSTYRARTEVHVEFEGEFLCTLFVALLGEEIKLRRSIFGVSITTPGDTNDVVAQYSLTNGLRHQVERLRRTKAVKADALKHFDHMRFDPETIARMKAQFEESFQRTASRLNTSIGYSTRPDQTYRSQLQDYASYTVSGILRDPGVILVNGV